MPIPADYGRASIEFLVGGVPGPQVMTFGFNDDNTRSADVIAESISDLFVAQFVPATSWPADSVLDRVRTSINRGGSDLAGEFVTSAVGSSGGTSVPPQVSAIMTKRTGIGGRKGKGRVYAVSCLIPDDEVDSSGLLSGSLQSDLATAWAAFIVALASDDLTMVLLHNDASTPTGVIDGTCERYVATQRRRTNRY